MWLLWLAGGLVAAMTVAVIGVTTSWFGLVGRDESAAGTSTTTEGGSTTSRVPAPVGWDEEAVGYTVMAGTVARETLGFHSDLREGELAVTVEGAAAEVVTLAAEDAVQVAETSQFEIPVTIAVPADGGADAYSGTVTIALGEAAGSSLAIEVRVTRPDGAAIPEGVSEPSPERIGTTPAGQEVVADELLVGLQRGLPSPDAEIARLAAARGAVIMGSVRRGVMYQLRFPGMAAGDLEGLRLALEADPAVRYAVLNAVVESSRTPDDAEWDSWNAGLPGGNNWGLEWIEVPAAWDMETGQAAVVVGVIDSDFDPSHEDLDENLGGMDEQGRDEDGHGTHVAGTICAEGNNGVGISGVAWDCSLQLFYMGSTDASAAEAMYDAIDAGARVVNMSLRSLWPSAEAAAVGSAVYADALRYALDQGRDVLWVIAAGNDGVDVDRVNPARLSLDFPDRVISVAAIDRQGNLASWSNRGGSVGVAAPGVDILSTVPRQCLLFVFCRNYEEKSGTSMAAPHVTGLAALMLSHRPDLTAAQLSACIVETARTGGTPVAGHGFFAINARAALECTDLPVPGAYQVPPVSACVIGSAVGETVNVRTGPGSRFEVVGVLEETATGIPTTGWAALDNDGEEWRQVMYGGETAWVFSYYLTRGECTVGSPQTYCVTDQPCDGGLYVLSGVNYPYPRIGEWAPDEGDVRGTGVSALDDQGRTWVQVLYEGRIGWSAGWFLDPSPCTPLRCEVPIGGTGDVQITLVWDSYADLDLHVIDPAGEEIYYANRISASGGRLDVDANAGCAGAVTDSPVENVFWPVGGAPRGRYRVLVDYFAACTGGTGPQNYTVIIRLDGEVVDRITGRVQSVDDTETVKQFSY